MLNNQKQWVLTVFVAVAASMVSLGFATEPEDGVDLFLKAVACQQNQSAISSGKVSYEMVRNEYKTEEEIQSAIDRQIASLKEEFADHPNLEKMLESVPESIRKSLSGTIRGTEWFDYSQKEIQYSKAQLTYDDGSDSPHTGTFIVKKEFHQGKPSEEAAFLDSSIGQAFVDNIGFSGANFHQFGRLQGVGVDLVVSFFAMEDEETAAETMKKQFQEIANKIPDTKYFEIVETKPFAEGAPSYTLETKFKGVVTQRFTIVPLLGYICPKIEFFSPQTGNLTEAYEAKDFVLHSSGIYYPTYCTELRYDPSTGNLVEKMEYKIDQETLALNEPMSPKDFSLEISTGGLVCDARDGKCENYTAKESGALTLEPGGLDLEQIPWLKKEDALTIQEPTRE